MPKMTEGQERVYLEKLGKRLQKTLDQVLNMAMNGELLLWCEFSDVQVMKQKKKKLATPEFQAAIELRIAPTVLAQMVGKADRLLVTAECACLTPKGKSVLVSNAVGEEWGETSMIGLQPGQLYAYMDAEEQRDAGDACTGSAEPKAPASDPVSTDLPQQVQSVIEAGEFRDLDGGDTLDGC